MAERDFLEVLQLVRKVPRQPSVRAYDAVRRDRRNEIDPGVRGV
jgi:hypothetical protein